MFCVYPADCTDFSNNGFGVVLPQSCIVDETLNGAYELTLIHPIDADGKWRRLMEGCILRAPVPAAMTPKVDLDVAAQAAACTEIYKITGGRVNLRSGKGTKCKVLKVYSKGTEVIVHDKSNASWYEITCPDGKHGYMSTKYLAFVRTESSPAVAEQTVVEPRQLRDQPFRIYRVVPELTKVTVYAHHIFYDLSENMIRGCKLSTSAIGAVVLQQLVSSCLSEHDFTFYSDLDSTADEVTFENINPVEALLGSEGFVEKYGGELAHDWYDVYLVEQVGTDSDVEIWEGKNLLGISYDVDLTEVTTRIMPTGEDKDGEILYLPEIYIDSPHISDYPQPKWIHLEVSGAKEVKSGEGKKTKAQCYEEMRKAVQAEFDKGCDLPTVTLKVDFINCAETEEYKDFHLLQNIYLGDRIRVMVPRIHVAVAMRMTQYSYDCLQRKYLSMTLGTAEETLEGSVITGRQLASGSVTSSKLAPNSVGSLQIRAAAIVAGLIDAEAITTEKLAAGVVTAEKLAAGAVDAGALSAITAKIGSLTTGDIETDTLAAALAAFTVITCGTASFDRATVTHLVAEALNLSFGVGDDVFINNLRVAYAQVISATIGNLCIKASNGNYYTIDVDASGLITATPATLTDQEIAAGQTNAGNAILETDITTESLSTSNLLATYALVNKIDAARIDVDSLFAREAFIARLTTSEIIAGKSLTIIAGEAAEAKETADKSVANVEVLYATGSSSTAAPTNGWSTDSPVHVDGQYVWQKTVTLHNNGTTTTSPPTCISGADGEPATTLRIESSRGTVFKNDTISTVLSAVIYRDSERITDAESMRRVFGAGAYIQWKWQRVDENSFGIISASDDRIGQGGFSFTLSPDDVDTKVTFLCELIV